MPCCLEDLFAFSIEDRHDVVFLADIYGHPVCAEHGSAAFCDFVHFYRPGLFVDHFRHFPDFSFRVLDAYCIVLDGCECECAFAE